MWLGVGADLVVVVFRHWVISDSFQPHELQHARPPCPSLSSGVCSNSCPLSQWCHSTISSSVAPLPTCLQSFPASGSFPRVFASKYWSFSFSVILPVNIQGWFPLGLIGCIKLGGRLQNVFATYDQDFVYNMGIWAESKAGLKEGDFWV